MVRVICNKIAIAEIQARQQYTWLEYFERQEDLKPKDTVRQ